jgi:hypothetical protein
MLDYCYYIANCYFILILCLTENTVYLKYKTNNGLGFRMAYGFFCPVSAEIPMCRQILVEIPNVKFRETLSG